MIETEQKKTLFFVLSLLKESHKYYKRYIQNGKKFCYTKKIRSVNQKIYDLLKSNTAINDPILSSIIADLIEHLEQWIQLWENKKNALLPDDNDVFVFIGYKNYPKDFEDILISYLKNNTN